MGFSYDYYKRIKPNRLILANPQGNDIDIISGVKEFKFKEYANSIDDLSFKIYEYEDGIHNELYDKIESMRLVKAQDFAVFQIKDVNDVHGEDIPVGYKEIACKSLENELIGKYINNLNGVYGLYDSSNQDYSILHIIAKYCTWTIGSVSPSLLTKFRTFSIDSEKIYNFLTGTVAESFGAIFQFDTWNKVINVITLEEFGVQTDIVISDKNVLKQYSKKSDLDKIITSMPVRGGTTTSGQEFDIRSINIDGSSEISNVNYYKTTDWMSQSLIDSLNSYQTACDSYTTQHTNALNLYKQYQSELLTLQNQLAEINAQISAQDQVTGASLKNTAHLGNPPSVGDTDYTIYQDAIDQIAILNAQKVAKESEISSKNSQISSTQTTLNNISNTLNKSNYFTTLQLKELDSFLTIGDEFYDETYTQTDTMTQEEVIQMKIDLKEAAEAELAKVCRPQYVIDTSLSNLWTIQDDKDSKVSYDLWRSQLKVGNLITLKFRSDYFIQIRLMSIEYDFDNLESVNLTFSDKNRLDDELTQLGEIISQAQSTSKSFSVNYYSILQASKSTSDFNAFRSGILDASLNQMKSDEKGEITFDEFGLKAKQVLSDGNIGSHQMWLNPWRMLFSDNYFQSANTAFGLLTLPDGTQRMGVNTDVIYGKLVMTENCYIENESGTYSFDKNGFVSSSTIGVNEYGVTINPSSPANIFSVSVNNVSKFYIDVNSNQLVMNGVINADSGTLNNLTVIGTLTGGTISGTTLSGGSININNAFKVNSSGVLTCTGANVSGNITGSSISGSTFLTTNTSLGRSTTIHDGIIESNYISLITITPNATTILYPNKVYLENTDYQLTITASGISRYAPSLDRTDTFLTSNNYSSYISYSAIGAASSSHGHSSTSITAVDTGYGNINLSGFDNAAGVNYVQNNFEPISTSDIRLKKNFKLLTELPDELYFALIPKQYEFICDPFNKNIVFGLIAQELISTFEQYGYNAFDYNLIEISQPRKGTDESKYVTDNNVYRINYNNFHAWNIYIIQKLNQRLLSLENKC